MASETDIGNRALQKIGASAIMAMSGAADAPRNARELALCYPMVRDAELRRHAWSFAMARASLPADDDAPAWGYDRSFTLPSDCLRVVEIDGTAFADLTDYRGQSQPAYRREGHLLLTDADAPLQIRYVRRVTDTALFDPCFIEALVCRLGAELAEPLAQSLPKKQMCLAEYKEAIGWARRCSALEAASETPPDDTWVTGRL